MKVKDKRIKKEVEVRDRNCLSQSCYVDTGKFMGVLNKKMNITVEK